jgi:hypothetical protein
MLSLSKEILNYLEHSNISSKKSFHEKKLYSKNLSSAFSFWGSNKDCKYSIGYDLLLYQTVLFVYLWKLIV